jgi:uncharacterized protein (DUF1684 family)
MRALLIALLCATFLAALPAGDYSGSVTEWREARERDLEADDGWLSVAGLFWLKEGTNTVGTDDSNDIVLPPGSAPKQLGIFDFHKGITVFHATASVPVKVNGKPAIEEPLKADTDGGPDVVQFGDLTMFVIHRGERFGIRLKDKHSEFRTNFTGLRWFPVNEEYRISAAFHPYPQPKNIAIPNILGETVQTPSPGYVEFSLRGAKLRLDPVSEGNHLFFVFRDRTAGKTTYGSGRFLDADAPVDGKVTLDFNKAYNPPCAFTPYATCPLPPASNRLSVAIEAGELKYGDH